MGTTIKITYWRSAAVVRVTARNEGEANGESPAGHAKARPFHSSLPDSHRGRAAPIGVLSSPTPVVCGSVGSLTRVVAWLKPSSPARVPGAPRQIANRAPGNT